MTTTVPTHGGPAVPVSSDTSGKTMGRVALRAYGFPSETDAIAAGFHSEAGPASSVYVVSAAELVSGKYVLEGDPKATPIYTAPAGMRVEGGYSQPVYLVGGSLNNAIPPIVPTYIARDFFTDTDGALITSHTMNVGTGWTKIEGSNTSTIVSNRLKFASDNPNTIVTPGAADGTVSVDVYFNAAGSLTGAGLVFRESNANNYWLVQISGAAIFYLMKKVAGSFSTVAQYQLPTLIANTPYTISAIFSGTSITVTVNGANPLYASDSFNQTATGVGVYHYGAAATNEKADNFSMTTGAFALYTTIDATSSPSGQNIRILRPATPNGALIIYHHGLGETQTALTADTLKQTCVWQLLLSGYTLAGSNAYGDNWGNANSVSAYPELYNYVTSHYSITRTICWIQSMGGCSGWQSFVEGTIPYRGLLATYPVCSLANMFNNNAGTYAASIRTAFGIAADGSDYATKTAGHDPLLLSASLFDGARLRFYASNSDTVVVKSANTDAMRTLVTGHSAVYDLVLCTGNHGDPSHFQPLDYLTFFNSCV